MRRQKSLLLFAGTTEGRILARWLEQEGISAVICTATEYGAELIDGERSNAENGAKSCIRIRSGRLDTEGIGALIREEGVGLVIDATHPYADQATANIRQACRDNRGVRLLRCLREEGEPYEQTGHWAEAAGPEQEYGVHCVSSLSEAAVWLAEREGNIFLTTGSKELAPFSQIPDYKERVYVRVLQLEDSVRLCRDQGYGGRHIIAMQGPFSAEMNEAVLKEFNCRFLVTKDGGRAGGFEEKLEAARRAGAQTVVIRRPADQGMSLEQVKNEVKEWNRQ